MSAGQFDALHSALADGLRSLKSAGQFQAVAVCDEKGMAWAAEGEVPAPDHFASIPALVERAFDDRQPLLRFFSDKNMRFEYKSDTLAYVKRGIKGCASAPEFMLDVPGDKGTEEPNEYVIGWDQSSLILRRIHVSGEKWYLLGITPNVALGRTSLAKAAPGLAKMLSAATGTRVLKTKSSDRDSVREQMLGALEAFQSNAPDILMAAVTSKDGFVVAALQDLPVDAELVAPLVGHSFLAIQESTEQLCGATESAMLRMEQGTLLARELTGDLLFAALLEPTACTGLVMSVFETTSVALRTALESLPTAVSETREEVAA